MKKPTKIQMNTERVVLITGASSGFGKACADHLSRRGYRVYGTSRHKQMANGPESGNSEVSFFNMLQMDVRDESSVTQGVKLLLARENRLDVVVNNAGIVIAGSVEDTSTAEVKDQFETNFFGMWRVCRAVLPQMRMQGGGYIVNISSLAGLIAVPFQAAYSASKFAVEGFTEALRMEVKPFGINVSLIEPGDFKTPLTANRQKTEQSGKNQVYREKFDRALRIMENTESNAPTPDKLALLLERIINDPSPRLRYTIGLMSQRVAAVIKRVAPGELFEWGVMKNYKL